jgi:hypothetical protein
MKGVTGPNSRCSVMMPADPDGSLEMCWPSSCSQSLDRIFIRPREYYAHPAALTQRRSTAQGDRVRRDHGYFESQRGPRCSLRWLIAVIRKRRRQRSGDLIGSIMVEEKTHRRTVIVNLNLNDRACSTNESTRRL